MIHSTPQAGRILCIAEPDSTPARKWFGLGFYVADELWDNCMEYRQISNRIAILRLQHKSMTRTKPVTISISIMLLYAICHMPYACRCGRTKTQPMRSGEGGDGEAEQRFVLCASHLYSWLRCSCLQTVGLQMPCIGR